MKNKKIEKIVVVSMFLSVHVFNLLCTPLVRNSEHDVPESEHNVPESHHTASKVPEGFKMKSVADTVSNPVNEKGDKPVDSNPTNEAGVDANLSREPESSGSSVGYDTKLDLKGDKPVDSNSMSKQLYDYVSQMFEKAGIMIKDFIASWSKMSPKQVNKLQSDLDTISQSAIDRMLTPKSDVQEYEGAAKKASKDIKNLQNLDKKIKNMPEGNDKASMQESLDGAYQIVANDLANIVMFAPDSVSVAKIMNDLPEDIQEMVNKLVTQKQEMVAGRSNKSQKGFFDSFAADSDNMSVEETVNAYKDKQSGQSTATMSDAMPNKGSSVGQKQQSEKALAAQKKIQDKISAKSDKNLDQELLEKTQTGALKPVEQNQNLFAQQDAQTDFSGVVKDVKAPNQPVSQKPSFLADISQGQFKLRSLNKDTSESEYTPPVSKEKQALQAIRDAVVGKGEGLEDGEEEGLSQGDGDLVSKETAKEERKKQRSEIYKKYKTEIDAKMNDAAKKLKPSGNRSFATTSEIAKAKNTAKEKAIDEYQVSDQPNATSSVTAVSVESSSEGDHNDKPVMQPEGGFPQTSRVVDTMLDAVRQREDAALDPDEETSRESEW